MESSILVAGLDEAGRGPVLGPMVICGIVLDKKTFADLKDKGVKDSKKISPGKREKLKVFLEDQAEEIEIVEFGPEEIDELRKEGTKLNEIEAIGFAKILDRLSFGKAYLDSASRDSDAFSSLVSDLMEMRADLIVEHKADVNYPSVSAASIVAKVRRDRRIDELKEKYGETGSGYPSDTNTIQFLREWVGEHESLPTFARKSWKTAQRIKSEVMS